MTNRITDAIECFRQMNSELAGETNTHGEQAKWAVGELSRMSRMQRLCDCSPPDFKQRCAEKLEHLGDIAVVARRHNTAINQYSTALSLNPVILQDIFVKRSKVYMAKGSWEDAIDDANQVRHFCLSQVRSYRQHHY